MRLRDNLDHDIPVEDRGSLTRIWRGHLQIELCFLDRVLEVRGRLTRRLIGREIVTLLPQHPASLLSKELDGLVEQSTPLERC